MSGETIAGMTIQHCTGENVVGVGILLPTIAGNAYRPPTTQVDDDDGMTVAVVIACVFACAVLVAMIVWSLLHWRANKTIVQNVDGAAKDSGP